MTVVGICMCKNEADIIGSVLDHMATQVDLIIVSDNNSTDDTFDILIDRRENGLPIEVLSDPDPAYYQSRKMSTMARLAADKLDAQWVIPFDADEIWKSRTHPTVRDHLNAQPPEVSIVMAELHDHVATGIDPIDDSPITRIRYRRAAPAELVKVAVRPVVNVVIGQGNHGAIYPSDRAGDLSICHFPYRSAAQFISKAINGAKAYAATDLPESQGAHWRQYGKIAETFGEEALGDVFREWFWVADATNDPAYVYEPLPTVR